MKAWYLLLFLTPFAFSADWTFDAAHSAAHFRVRHMMVSHVSGTISGFKGTVSGDEKEPAKTKVNVTLDVATINTDNTKRDDHLKSAEFFDAAKYPTISFKSKKMIKSGEKWTVVGDLTMHGVTKEITLKDVELSPVVKDPWGHQRRGLTARTSLNRKDFGITWNKTMDGGGLLIGETVDITIDAEATK
ncbi:MAG: YceI family protein [Deltaproteobacteria bacterium]|nr:YceI family protein [Deltaproteobacteria bacterium]